MATLGTPGVYIKEVESFPNSIVPVATAVPAFIGYTRSADFRGKSCLFEPVRISSLEEFLIFFGAPEAPQYQPIYLASASKGTGEIIIAGKPYDILPDPTTIYYLYNSIRLFYQNGGGDCYIVSVGLIGPPPAAPKAMGVTDPLVNPNVDLDALQKGLEKLSPKPGPTMIVIPDGLLLGRDKYATLMQSVLTHCGTLQDRVGIFDVFGGDAPDPETWEADDIAPFRSGVGMNDLKYGIAYYPFLKTTVTQDGDINYNNLGGAEALTAVLPVEGNDLLKSLLGQIATVGTSGGPTVHQVENGLLLACPDYKQLHRHVLEKINILPPSAAMAGVYTKVDSTQGVWKAPANVSLVSVVDTTLSISDHAQGPLNVDAATGKSINAIRRFPGLGLLVWGARTLDGNSMDWCYINVLRTMIMIEQTVKLAARGFVFEPNVAGTWSTIRSTLDSFLTTLWKQGGLAGTIPAAAFNVAVGLGTTMTADDILNGFMNIIVYVAVSHPAEFIAIAVSQQQQAA